MKISFTVTVGSVVSKNNIWNSIIVDVCNGNHAFVSSIVFHDWKSIHIASIGIQSINYIYVCSVFAEIRNSQDRKSTRLNSSHVAISYAVFCLKKKNK